VIAHGAKVADLVQSLRHGHAGSFVVAVVLAVAATSRHKHRVCARLHAASAAAAQLASGITALIAARAQKAFFHSAVFCEKLTIF